MATRKKTRPKKVTVEAHCNRCGPDTNHELLKSLTIPGENLVGEQHWYEYQFNQCKGCKRTHLRERLVFPDLVEHAGQMPEWQWYHPPAITRQQPEWMRRNWKELLPVSRMLAQTYEAHQHGLSSLAVMGCRALLDMAVTKLVGTHPISFEAMLKQAKYAGIIYEEDVKLLVAAFDTGSAVMHRGFVPEPKIVEQVFDITENALQRAYVLRGRDQFLKSATPPRPQKLPKSGGAAPSP